VTLSKFFRTTPHANTPDQSVCRCLRSSVSLIWLPVLIMSLMPAYQVHAHEFWIESDDVTIDAGTSIVASLRNGENFQGSEMLFIPQNFRQFVLYDQSITRNVESRLGDSPALHEPADKEALYVAVYESTDSVLSYDNFAKFEEFATREDVRWILEEHTARALPTANIAEVYTRFAKSLFGVGSASGNDKSFELELELIALTNPYQLEENQNMQFMLSKKQQPQPDTQIYVFHKPASNSTAASETSATIYRTDAKGIVSFPVESAGQYLVNAVVVKNTQPQQMLETGAFWHSLWASSTFVRE